MKISMTLIVVALLMSCHDQYTDDEVFIHDYPEVWLANEGRCDDHDTRSNAQTSD